MSLLTSWDEHDDEQDGQDDGHRGLVEAVVSSMFDVNEVEAAAGADGEDVMDDAFLQEAILEHAKFLGMDPQRDKAFLWIAEEVRTAHDTFFLLLFSVLFLSLSLSVCVCASSSFFFLFFFPHTHTHTHTHTHIGEESAAERERERESRRGCVYLYLVC
jgi:hypothetical protein